MSTPISNTGCLCARNWNILTALPGTLITNAQIEVRFTQNFLTSCLDTVTHILRVWDLFENMQSPKDRQEVHADGAPVPKGSSVSF